MLLLIAVGCAPTLPELEKVDRVIWMQKDWGTEDERQWYRHASQGTATFPLPYEWFMALEVPEIAWYGTPKLLTDNSYILRFGFIPGERSEYNGAGLPVGFAVDYDFQDMNTGKKYHAIGLTCAACHTGRLTYKGTDLRIDGGSANVNLDKLTQALGVSLLYTKYVPGRFNRFAKKILGEKDTPAAREVLRSDLNALLAKLSTLKDWLDAVKKGNVEEGFARVDALNRIGNQVFAIDPGRQANFHPFTAPVNFPFIWTAPWYAWVQFNGSIMQPMVRNAGESLGVASSLNLTGDQTNQYSSTVRVENIHEMEIMLAGKNPPQPMRRFAGLSSPRWPEDILGQIDTVKAKKGEELYRKHCAGCHLPAITPASEFWNQKNWVNSDRPGYQYLKVNAIPIAEVGTDPEQANVVLNRTINATGFYEKQIPVNAVAGDGCKNSSYVQLKIDPTEKQSFALSLGIVVEKAVNYYYDQNRIPLSERKSYDRYRPNNLRACSVYNAVPLNGVWATPPFLHNGSVPSLYDLLSPVSERPESFYLGSSEYDPVRIGYSTERLRGGFKMDTSIQGNLNTGHEFNDGKGKGIIGPRLQEIDRWAIIEYLKTL